MNDTFFFIDDDNTATAAERTYGGSYLIFNILPLYILPFTFFTLLVAYRVCKKCSKAVVTVLLSIAFFKKIILIVAV